MNRKQLYVEHRLLDVEEAEAIEILKLTGFLKDTFYHNYRQSENGSDITIPNSKSKSMQP